MLYIPLLFIVAGLGMIGVVVIRKFPQLTNIDVENLPQEREARKKKEIISRRVAAEGSRIVGEISEKISPLKKMWGKIQLQFRIYVGKVERLLHHEQRTLQKKSPATTKVVAVGAQQELLEYVQNAEKMLMSEQYDRAEELFIAAIKLNPKHAPAYRGLADTYYAKGNQQEAEETYQFLLQLTPQDDTVLAKLGELAEERGDTQKAIEYYQQAVVLNDALSPRFYHLAELLLKVKQPEIAKEAILSAVDLEPKNPKYLDLLIEIGILCGDKDLAEQGYQELRLVNPKNQKLAVFLERIKNIGQ